MLEASLYGVWSLRSQSVLLTDAHDFAEGAAGLEPHLSNSNCDADFGDLRTFNEPALRLRVARGAVGPRDVRHVASRMKYRRLYTGARTYVIIM